MGQDTSAPLPPANHYPKTTSTSTATHALGVFGASRGGAAAGARAQLLLPAPAVRPLLPAPRPTGAALVHVGQMPIEWVSRPDRPDRPEWIRLREPTARVPRAWGQRRSRRRTSRGVRVTNG